MPDDISFLHEEFLVNLLGKEGAEEKLLEEHLWLLRKPRPPTWRCRLRGCVALPACRFWPRCDRCAGCCKRCRQPVAPRAKVE